MTAAEYKLQIFQELLPVENTKSLEELYEYVKKFLKNSVSQKSKTKKAKKKTEPESFEEWNEQFTDKRSLEEFIPEYGMTLGEFRREMYEAEVLGEEEPMENFHQYLKNLYEKN